MSTAVSRIRFFNLGIVIFAAGTMLAAATFITLVLASQDKYVPIVTLSWLICFTISFVCIFIEPIRSAHSMIRQEGIDAFLSVSLGLSVWISVLVFMISFVISCMTQTSSSPDLGAAVQLGIWSALLTFAALVLQVFNVPAVGSQPTASFERS